MMTTGAAFGPPLLFSFQDRTASSLSYLNGASNMWLNWVLARHRLPNGGLALLNQLAVLPKGNSAAVDHPA